MSVKHTGAIFCSLLAATTAVALLLLTGCPRDPMVQQPHYKPLEPSTTFADGTSARPIVEGTVPRTGWPPANERNPWYATAAPATTLPFKLTREDLVRGQQRFTIYCTPCHGRLGNGQGMIVQRGFVPPPSFHIDRLRQAPIGHFYDVITNGFGAMYSYNDRIAPTDRWRIAAYVRALQLSQDARNGDLPAADRQRLEELSP